ncbi:30S ribosomal protein S14 [Salana multivorans]
MAKKSKIARNEQRRAVVAHYAEVRRELKKASVDPARSREEREAAMRALHRLPRDASPTRLRNRDVSDGRPRGHLRKFGLSRVQFRERALRGELPGVTKSSW